VELLVVIGIIALLISILLPSLGKARDSANKVKCEATLHSLGQGIYIYTAVNKGTLPMGVFWDGTSNDTATDWVLLVQATLMKGAPADYTGFLKYSAYADLQARRMFMCSEAPDVSFSSAQATASFLVTNCVCYSANPAVLGGQIYSVGPDDSSQGPGITRPMRLSTSRHPSDTAMLFDASVYPFSPGTFQQYADNPDAVWLDNGGFTKYAGLSAASYTRLNPASNLGNSVDMTPLSNSTADCNKDNAGNAFNIRFRHMKNTVSNVLFIDGHVQSFTLNPMLPPSSARKTDFLRRYIYQ
jgi:prepilin-type processing-associated H-X9-DG protein